MQLEFPHKQSDDVNRLWFMRAVSVASPGSFGIHASRCTSAIHGGRSGRGRSEAEGEGVLPSIQRERERLAQAKNLAAMRARQARSDAFDRANCPASLAIAMKSRSRA